MDAMTLTRLPFFVCHHRCYVAIRGSRNHGREEFSGDFRHESDAMRHLLTGSLVLSERLDKCCSALSESGGTFLESVVNLLNQSISRLFDLVFSCLHFRCEGAISCLERLDLIVSCAAACAQLVTTQLRLLPEGATFSGSAMNTKLQIIKLGFTCAFADWLPCSKASRQAGFSEALSLHLEVTTQSNQHRRRNAQGLALSVVGVGRGRAPS